MSIKRDPSAPEDYYGPDRLKYCGICRTPKECYSPGNSIFDSMPHPIRCACQQAELDRENAVFEARQHRAAVQRLRADCFRNFALMEDCSFDDEPQGPFEIALKYTASFEELEKRGLGLLFWGGVGSGKTHAAACIANSLCNSEISAKMCNFAQIFNDLMRTDDRNAYIRHLDHYRLLIIDDFGAERNTDYSLEQVHNIIDYRYCGKKPLIITTNLTLDDLRNPQDDAHHRIYDRILAMCVPIGFGADNLRTATAKEHFDFLKKLCR